MDKVLRLLELGKKYKIQQDNDDLTHRIIDYENNLAAIVDGEDVSYYVIGAYDSGTDYLEIDMKALNNLKEFVEGLK